MTVKDIDLVSTEELAEMDAQTSYTSPIFGSYGLGRRDARDQAQQDAH